MIFWVVVSCLLVLALLILMVPLVRGGSADDGDSRQQQNIKIARDKKTVLDRQLAKGEISQQEYESGLLELETALALDLENNEITSRDPKGKWAIWLVLGLVPLISTGLYFQLGEYRIIEQPALAEVVESPQAEADHSNLSIEEMVEIVRQRLAENPDDAQGWFVLGKTMMVQQKFEEAIAAFERTLELVGEEPGVMFSLADAIAMQHDGAMQGKPRQLVDRGLELAPNHPTGLWLAGLAAEQRQDYRSAHAAWTRLISLIEDDPESILEIRELINVLEQRDPSLADSTQPVRMLTLKIDLDDSLKDLVSPMDSLFIYAKAASGPPMPLAVKRLLAGDLPVEVSLSDSDAMMPEMKLSAFDRVIVGARISKSGNPVAQPGDLFVEVQDVDSSNPPEQLQLTIDKVK
jgi:cytochrome c-type biogenesis protein CcmH